MVLMVIREKITRVGFVSLYRSIKKDVTCYRKPQCMIMILNDVYGWHQDVAIDLFVFGVILILFFCIFFICFKTIFHTHTAVLYLWPNFSQRPVTLSITSRASKTRFHLMMSLRAASGNHGYHGRL